MTRTVCALGIATLMAITPAVAFGVENLKSKPLEVTVSKTSKASADNMWKAIGDFCGVKEWHPAVVKCAVKEEGGDTYRTLELDGGGEILEKKISFDDATRSYAYTIEESPLPVKNYSAKIEVKEDGDGSVVNWSAKFNSKDATDEKAVETITSVFQAGVDSLVAGLDK